MGMMIKTELVALDFSRSMILVHNLPPRYQPFSDSLCRKVIAKFMMRNMNEELLLEVHEFVQQWIYKMMDDVGC